MLVFQKVVGNSSDGGGSVVMVKKLMQKRVTEINGMQIAVGT